MAELPKVVSTILYTEGSQRVKDEVEEELKVPDPEPGTAQAAIENATPSKLDRDDLKKYLLPPSRRGLNT